MSRAGPPANGLVQSVINLSEKLSGKQQEVSGLRQIAHFFFTTNQIARSLLLGGTIAFFFSNYFFPEPEISKYGIYGKYVEDDDDEEHEEGWWDSFKIFIRSHGFLTTTVIFSGLAYLFI